MCGKIRPVLHRVFGFAGAAAFVASAAGGEVNLYTDRQEIFLRDVLSAYEKQSGDSVNVLFIQKGLLERAKAEGEASPADVFLLADIGRVADFVDAGLAATVRDPQIESALHESLRDADGKWFAITRRARAIFVAPDSPVPNSYAQLADAKYRNAICLRRGSHPYNNALFADLGARRGAESLKQWLAGIKKNLARDPGGKDRAQINAVADKECKIGIANSYYYFHLLHNADEKRRAHLRDNVQMIMPEDIHINITGMMRAKHAPNPQAARRLMQFLIGERAQNILAAKNFEFPARDDIAFPPQLKPYKNAVQNAAPLLRQTSEWRKLASELTDETGFDR